MKKDPTEFRKRFAAWKNGEQVYKDGLPAYRGGKDSGKINYSRWDNAELTSYPVPFIDEKRITLTNAGRATGAVLSTNLLDSIADNANRAGLPLQTALGLAVKESTLGNPTDDRTAWNLSSGIRQAFNNKYPGTEQHINHWGDALNEREDVINYHKGHQSDDPASGHKSVLQEAFEFYKQHPDKYNTGQKDYQTSVDKRGVEVMQSPEIKRWKNAYDTKKKVRPWTKPNPLLKESKFNLPKYGDGKDVEYTPQKDIYDPIKSAQNAIDFAKFYYSSDGFKQRFKNINKYSRQFLYSPYNPASLNTKEDGIVPMKYTWSIQKMPMQQVNKILPIPDRNAYYDPRTRNIYYGDSGTLQVGLSKTWDEIMAHEAGHLLDYSIKPLSSNLKGDLDNYNDGYGYTYSNMIPVLRKSKSYQRVRKMMYSFGDTEGRLYDQDPSFGYNSISDKELHHDAMPMESYADLFQLRKMLYDQKIFDSTKPGIKFTKQHLDKFKQNNHIRLQNNFTDDQIIWMINNVANRNKHTDNEV